MNFLRAGPKGKKVERSPPPQAAQGDTIENKDKLNDSPEPVQQLKKNVATSFANQNPNAKIKVLRIKSKSPDNMSEQLKIKLRKSPSPEYADKPKLAQDFIKSMISQQKNDGKPRLKLRRSPPR